jgi:hypothetical protein
MHTRAIYYIFICVWGSNSRADVTETFVVRSLNTITYHVSYIGQFINITLLVHLIFLHICPSIIDIDHNTVSIYRIINTGWIIVSYCLFII